MTRAPEGKRWERGLAWLGASILLVLHLDFWRPQEARLVLGWIPEDLAYRLLWMLLATLYLFWFTARIWKRSSDGDRGD